MQHCWIYGGTQIGDAFAIVPLDYEYNTSHPPRDVVDKCQIVSLIRATPEDLAKYPRMDWNQKKKYLFNKYTEFYQIALKKYGNQNTENFRSESGRV